MEAQRVLRRLGFVCREAQQVAGSTPTTAATGDGDAGLPERLSSIETTVAVLEAAVAGLHGRVRELEALRQAE